MYAARAMRWPRCILIVMPHARRAGSQTPPHVTRNRFPPRERPTGALLDAAMSQAPGDRDAGQREKGGKEQQSGLFHRHHPVFKV